MKIMTSDCPVPNLFLGAEGVAIAIFQISVFAMFLMLFRSISGRRGGRRSYLSNVDNVYVFYVFRPVSGRRGGRKSYFSKIDRLYVVDALPICFWAQRGSQ